MSRLRSFTSLGLLACLSLSALAGNASAGPVFDKIKDQGSVQLCTNVNNPPFAFLSSSGDVQGVQKPLFDDVPVALSKEFGTEIKLEIVPVLPSNRIQFLQQGKCDLIFALTANAERRKVIKFIEPAYYALGPGLVTRRDLTIAKWEDLKGQNICSNSGSSYNQALEQKFGAVILAFQTQQEVDQSLRDGRCIGLISDDAPQQIRMKTDTWKDYKLQDLPPYDGVQPSALAINFGDDELDQFLSKLVKSWHKSGKIIEQAKAFGLTPPQAIFDLHDNPDAAGP